MDEKQINLIIKIIVILIIVYLGYRVLQLFGIIQQKSVTDSQIYLNDSTKNVGFDESFHKTDTIKNTIPLVTYETSKNIARQIYEGMHFFGLGIKDAQILNGAYRIKSKRVLSQVADVYRKIYNVGILEDMATTIQDNVINRYASNDIFPKILNYWNNLPVR